MPKTRGKMRVAGLMSGTSADGVDVAIVDVAGREVDVLAFETYPYAPAVRRSIFSLFDAQTARVDDICHMNFVLGELFADAVIRLARRAKISLRSIDLIGSHGQTIHHLPDGRMFGGRRVRSTLQIGEPCVIAERTGITTVADFRPRDIAAGGEGAPLVPLTDYLLFSHARLGRAVQNIGGIANVTYLPAGGNYSDVLAFDTGPGNMMIDRLVHRVTRGRQNYDAGGKIARRGRACEKILARWMRHAYLRRRPPKSTGRELFGTEAAERFYRESRTEKLSPADIVATATAFTAASIADAYRRFLPGVDEAILCGGGSRNVALVEMLRRRMSGAKVRIIDELGVNADAKEAVSFAMLAYRTILGLPGNVPSATGAKREVVLGKIIPGVKE